MSIQVKDQSDVTYAVIAIEKSGHTAICFGFQWAIVGNILTVKEA